MDPMSSLLGDPLYHLTHDVYGFGPLQLPFEPNQTLQEPGLQTTNDMINNNSVANPPRDEGPIDDHDGPKMDGGDRRKRTKGVMHKEVERQRRQEMTSLHHSLRSLLPVEYLKGKRSMTDHLNEAVKYIRHLEAKNKALRHKRDMLKGAQTGLHCQLMDQVVVMMAGRDGVQVLVEVNANEMAIPTSAVLKALIQEGLDITSCLTAHTSNNKWLHCVQAQVHIRVGEGNVYNELQQKLAKRLSFSQ